MSQKISSEAVSRRRALCTLAAAVGFAVPAIVLTIPEAEAQTIGMQRRYERRHERRLDRHDRRQDRRVDRTERRFDRRLDRRTGVMPQ
jgi:hypothetical protein